MNRQARFKNLWHNEQGATAIEFALVSGTFFMLMMGIIEYGLYAMTQVTIESAVNQAGRMASVGYVTPGETRAQTMARLISEKTVGLHNASLMHVDASPVQGDAEATRKPDYCLVNGIPTAGVPYCANPDGSPAPYVEGNHIPGYQSGLEPPSLGLEDQMVEIRATYPWKVTFPILTSHFGDQGVVLISSTIVVKNERFGQVL